MANEGPSIHDGACIAAADFRDSTLSGTTHLGQNGSLQYSAVRLSTVVANDRSLLGCTVAGQEIYGILQNKPGIGQAADVMIFGISKVICGATLQAGNDLMVDSSGYLIAYASAAGQTRVGKAITTPGAVGEIFTAAIFGFGMGGGSIA